MRRVLRTPTLFEARWRKRQTTPFAVNWDRPTPGTDDLEQLNTVWQSETPLVKALLLPSRNCCVSITSGAHEASLSPGCTPLCTLTLSKGPKRGGPRASLQPLRRPHNRSIEKGRPSDVGRVIQGPFCFVFFPLLLVQLIMCPCPRADAHQRSPFYLRSCHAMICTKSSSIPARVTACIFFFLGL